jgi:hypothetical protein
MAGSFNEIAEDAPTASTVADVEMAEGATESAAATENHDDSELPFTKGGPDDPSPPAPRITFLQYLTSPIVTLLIGSGESETILTAHQSLLVQSPFFAGACAEFADDGSVCRSIPLPAALQCA